MSHFSQKFHMNSEITKIIMAWAKIVQWLFIYRDNNTDDNSRDNLIYWAEHSCVRYSDKQFICIASFNYPQITWDWCNKEVIIFLKRITFWALLLYSDMNPSSHLLWSLHEHRVFWFIFSLLVNVLTDFRSADYVDLIINII